MTLPESWKEIGQGELNPSDAMALREIHGSGFGCDGQKWVRSVSGRTRGKLWLCYYHMVHMSPSLWLSLGKERSSVAEPQTRRDRQHLL